MTVGVLEKIRSPRLRNDWTAYMAAADIAEERGDNLWSACLRYRGEVLRIAEDTLRRAMNIGGHTSAVLPCGGRIHVAAGPRRRKRLDIWLRTGPARLLPSGSWCDAGTMFYLYIDSLHRNGMAYLARKVRLVAWNDYAR
jgi:hypothetical protein